MEKLKVLVVDDEYWITKLIIKLIHWEELELNCIGCCDGGETAERFILAEHPDIVITDINMPGMSGMEVIKNVQKQGVYPRFILLSGSADFQLAQQAIQYGIKRYILKPINEIEINNALMDVIHDCYCERERVDKERKIEETLKSIQPLIIREMLMELNKTPSISLQDLNRKYRMSFKDLPMRAFTIKLDQRELDLIENNTEEKKYREIADFIESAMRPYVNEIVVSSIDNDSIIGIVSYEGIKKLSVEVRLQEMFKILKKDLYIEGKYELTMGIGNEVGFESIKQSIELANKCIGARVGLGVGTIIYYYECQDFQKINVVEFMHHYKSKIINSIQSFSRKRINDTIEEIFGELQRKNMIAPEVYYQIAHHIIDLCCLSESKDVWEEARKAGNRIDRCCTLSSMIYVLKQYIKHIMPYMEIEKQQMSDVPVRKAREYIHKHYSEKIDLEDMVQLVNLNPSYFSVLFKKETGKNFLNYLTEVRIEHAKELLSTTNESIANVALRVGYIDSRYFSQCFRKIAGMLPSTYRKMYS